jgi:NAD-dependent DNA ligase
MGTALQRYASDRITENVNMTVPFYLMAAYAYYQEDDPIFSDYFFDNLAQKILKEWDNITH